MTATKVKTALEVRESILKKLNKLDNTYGQYANSIFKTKARNEIIAVVKDLFKDDSHLKIANLGGESMALENALKHNYKLTGVSYELNDNSIDIAKKNAPKGIIIKKGNIFSHVYNGENIIWFDTTCACYEKNIYITTDWINNNPIKTDMVFVVTYILAHKVKGNGYKQRFGGVNGYMNYLDEIKDNIYGCLQYPNGIYNNEILVSNEVKQIIYANKDINVDAKEMVQFIFKINKK